MYIGRNIDSINNISTLDNLSFNGSLQTFNLTQNSVAFVPVSADALQIQIDGVIQANNFTISGSTVTFDFVPNSGSVCNSVKHFGVGIITSVSDGAVTNTKLGADSVNGTKIADDSISDEHLDITAITGQTAITSLADTDKFLVSDASDSGNLKYVEKQYLPSGSHVKLLSGSASSSVNHDFQNFMDTSKYRSYLVQFTDVVSAGNNERLDFIFVADTTLQNGSNYWGAVSGLRSSGTQYFDNYEQITQGKLGTGLVMNSGNAGNYLFYVFNAPNQQDMSNSVYGQNWGYRSDYGDYMFTNFTFGLNNSANVTGMRITESGGNATTFDYQIYGILK